MKKRKFWNIFKILTLLSFALLSASCDGNGCIEAEEFDTKYIKVESNPISEGVFGAYDDVDGGQVAEWKNTGLRTANEDFIILVSGGWVPWKAGSMTKKKFLALKECNICSKRQNNPKENCICMKHKMQPDFEEGQHPQQEIAESGLPSGADCSKQENQDNPDKCTCTTFNGRADDYGVFHFPLNYYSKNHIRKPPDRQSGACKYNRGIGLYLGVFGKSSNETPNRIYHLFSEEEICPIARNSKGKCIDEEGVNRLKYVFRSRNQKTFVKDDNAGNVGEDSNPEDDTYHKANEYVKLIINDRYYSDNYGHYNVEFLKGVFSDDDVGLLEFVVRIVEDSLLGEKNSDGVRENGVLEFLFNAIVKDTNFLLILNISLILYIAFFGVSSLLGFVELSKKEIYGRIVKLGVIALFTHPDSWSIYNQIVVGFFKDGMDAVLDIVVSLGEIDLDEETNPLVLAQLGSTSPDSTGSRFAYVDVMLRTLFSENVTKKIWGLFFYSIFGLVYIAMIYAAIFYFLYVMLMAASVYAITITKMMLALAIGPIMITFSLFKTTNEYTKKWIGFLGARSLEMIILFLLLYTLVGLVDKKFNELLFYKVCYENFVNGYINIKILKAHVDRSLFVWLAQGGTLMAFIFMTHMIMDQIPSLAGSLISIGGVANQSGSGQSNSAGAFGMASKMAADVFGAARSAAGASLKYGGGGAFRAARIASRESGLSGAIDRAAGKIPIRGPRRRMRDAIIDGAIRRGQAEAKRKGLRGADFDKYVRDYALNDKKTGLHAWMHKNPNKAALLDFDRSKISARLDKKLIDDPLKKFIKDEAKRLKKQDADSMPLGKDMRKKLKESAREWAKNNLAGGADSINDKLHDMKGFLKKKSSFSAREASKKFGSDQALRDRYLQSLKSDRVEKYGANSKKADLSRSTKASNFLQDSLGTAGTMGELRSSLQKADYSASRSYLMNGGFNKDISGNADHYNKKMQGQSDFKKGEIGRKQGRMEERLMGKKDTYKAAMLNAINAKAQQEMAGASAERMAELRATAKQEYIDAANKHRDKINELSENGTLGDALKNGGKSLYQEGLVDIDGDSLFEAKARALAYGVQDADAQDTAFDSSGFATPPETGQGSGGAGSALIQDPELQFGATLEDAFSLKSADIGLKAGSVTLSNGEEIQHDDVLISSLSSNLQSSQQNIKSKKYELSLKEHEQSSLDPNKPEDKQKIAQLDKEIQDLKKDVSSEERKASSIESKIIDAKNS